MKKLSVSKIRNICELLESGEKVQVIADKFNVTKQCISLINCGKIYNDISCEYNIGRRQSVVKQVITEEKLEEISQLILKGETNRDIAKKMNLHPNTISKIRLGTNHGSYTSKYDFPKTPPHRKYSLEKIEYVCSLMEKGYSNTDIVNEVDIAYSTVYEIRSGRRHQDVSCKYKVKPDTYRSYGRDRSEIEKVCEMIEKRYCLTYIAEVTGVSLSAVSYIRNGKYYKDISKNYKFPENNKDLIDPRKPGYIDNEKVECICQLIQDGFSDNDISEKTGVNIYRIKGIRSGVAHTEISKNYNFK